MKSQQQQSIGSVRAGMFIGLLVSAGLVAVALFFQFYLGMQPCPLCIVQRLVFFSLAALFLFGLIQSPKTWGRRIFGFFIALFSIFGVAVAARHSWLQHLPNDQIPECGPGLDYWMKTLPTDELIQKLLQGSGECAEVSWTLARLSIPEWNIIIFSVFAFYGFKLLIFR